MGLPKLSPAPYSVNDALKDTPVAAAAAVEEALVEAAAVETLVEAAAVEALVEAATVEALVDAAVVLAAEPFPGQYKIALQFWCN